VQAEFVLQLLMPLLAQVGRGDDKHPALSRLLDGQAVMLATNDFYALACVLTLVFAALVWLVKPVSARFQTGAGH